jgi:hypothetical protein
MCFPLLAPPHPSILTPYSSLILFLPHPWRPVLRRYLLLVGHDATAHDLFRAMRGPVDPACTTRSHVDHACATRGPVDPASATRGHVDPVCATRGPVDPGSLRQPRTRLPPPRPRHYLGAP